MSHASPFTSLEAFRFIRSQIMCSMNR